MQGVANHRQVLSLIQRQPPPRMMRCEGAAVFIFELYLRVYVDS